MLNFLHQFVAFYLHGRAAMRLVSSRSSLPAQTAERHLARIAWIPGSSTRVAEPERAPLPDPEALFEALDGHALHGPHHSWQIRVYSILEERGWRWVQLALEGDPDCMVTMRTSLDDDGEETLRVLSAWMQNPTRTPAPDIFIVA